MYNVRTMLYCGAFAELLLQREGDNVFHFIVYGAAVNNIKAFSIAIKMQQWIPFSLLSSCKIFRNALNSISY